ncbi:hypothetical protein CVT25_015188 [Psilocybe cyanescens]|uniref:Nephrocystin 3-like N-terminal domain-containing protein n=1 Tax=Psilocybe cyanescens TaxID=93625 RepID=A0A409WRQ3_PSICY|nr:hypothetical protein CVT25_015188 [Psilocybe cyanescens]
MPKDKKYSSIRAHRTLNSGMQLLQGARNFTITGGSFRQIEGDYYDGGRDLGLLILGQHIAPDAIYNSAERFPPAKCHPGTREKIISTILDWANDPTPREQVLWLNGPAGAGKFAIAHSIAILLQEISEDSKYAGSFFFAKDAIGRGDGTKLFSTIAYQLALKFPSFRALIDIAMLDNPTLPTKSIDVQLRYLIIEPLLRVDDWPAHSPTIIIDGLDECAELKRMQSDILALLSKAIIKQNIPLRFLIVSRPEYWISDSFEIGPLVNVTKSFSLRDDEDADVEIEMYLREGFNKIYEENRGKYSNNYVYASTVLQFVGDSSNICDPREQLHILTTPGQHRASAFSDLDKLYATVLASYPGPNAIKRVLGGLVLAFSEKTIQEILGVDSGEIQLVLRALSSLIRISKVQYSEEFRAPEPIFGSPLQEASISCCHLSFEEFLTDESRSGKYVIDESAVRHEFACTMLKLGVDIVQDSPKAERTIARSDDQLSIQDQWKLVHTADRFLRYSRISDIHSKEYFEDPKKMEILSIIMDTSFGDCLRHPEISIDLVLAALGWFNRHMTGPSKDVIREYDSSLPQTMLCAAKRIFEIAYLPRFTGAYCSNLWIYSDSDSSPSVSLHIIPPSHNATYSFVEEKPLDKFDIPIVDFSGYNFHGCISEFHEQVFAGGELSSVISPYDWYPHIAAFLLAMLVKNQYAALNTNFEEDSGWKTITKKCFLPFIKCLPYAIPTQQNLNAIRALHYLCPKMHPRRQWRPPFGFCSLAMDFLKKYDRSSLSSSELNSLKYWLSDLRTRESKRVLHGDIRSDRQIYYTDDAYTTDEGES